MEWFHNPLVICLIVLVVVAAVFFMVLWTKVNVTAKKTAETQVLLSNQGKAFLHFDGQAKNIAETNKDLASRVEHLEATLEKLNKNMLAIRRALAGGVVGRPPAGGATVVAPPPPPPAPVDLLDLEVKDEMDEMLELLGHN